MPFQEYTRIVAISDTHSRTPIPSQVPNGDIFIHAGDMLQSPKDTKTPSQAIEYLNWIKALPHAHKIVIAGNHDHNIARYLSPDNGATGQTPEGIAMREAFHDTSNGFKYLQNESYTVRVSSGRELEFFGSPMSLMGNSKAFQYCRGTNPWILENGKPRIPPTTQILITHGPPADHPPTSGSQYLDRDSANGSGGDEDLTRALPPHLLLAICGHVHNAHGAGERFLTSKQDGEEQEKRYLMCNVAGVVSNYPDEPYEEEELRLATVVDLDCGTGEARVVGWEELLEVQPGLERGCVVEGRNRPLFH